MKKRYRYSGPVMHYNVVVASNWTRETMAESENKAIANFAYRFRKECGLVATYNVRLPNSPQLISNETGDDCSYRTVVSSKKWRKI